MPLIPSIFLSLAIWTFLVSFKFSIIIITAIFIHEYGHYYWMGREGITKKSMFFLPPFGAVAQAKEFWPTRGAEARIALAGPAFGLLSLLLFYCLWLLSPSPLFIGAMGLACYINLFNILMPVAILDGGRIIKSILFSVHNKLGEMFYLFSFIVLGLSVLFGFISIFLGLLIGFLLWREDRDSKIIRSRLDFLHSKRDSLRKLEQIREGLSPQIIDYISDTMSPDTLKDFEEEIVDLEKHANIKKMDAKEIITSFLLFIGIISIYSLSLYALSTHTDISYATLIKYF